MDQSKCPSRPISLTQSPLISVTRYVPLVVGKAPFGLVSRCGGSCAQMPVWPMTRRGRWDGGASSSRRQFSMSAVMIIPPGIISASSGLAAWLFPLPGTPGVPYR